jgi:hypothetical protein
MRKLLEQINDESHWDACLRAIQTARYHLLAGREDVRAGELLRLMLRGPDGTIETFDAQVARVTPGKGATLEVHPVGLAPWADVEPQAHAAGPSPDADEITQDNASSNEDTNEPVMEPDSPAVEGLQEEAEPTDDPASDRSPDLPSYGSGAEQGDAEEVDDEKAYDADADTDEGKDKQDAKRPEPEAPPAKRRPQTLHARIQAMGVQEKKKLAMTADRSERSVLIRDQLKQIHPYVLRNPHIQQEEVGEYAKYAGLSPVAIKFISEQLRWMQSPTLRFTLIRNPQIPREVASKVADGLNLNQLRWLVKHSGVRPDIRQVARRILERRGKM